MQEYSDSNFVTVKCHITFDFEKIDHIGEFMYGIKVFANDKIFVYPALSGDKSKIERLINDINTSNVQLCHIQYIIEDFLQDNYGMKLFAQD